MNIPSKTFSFAGHSINRIGYGAMQLAGPGVYGEPENREEAIAVLREAVSSGVNHIDTSDFYGPHITNQIIKEALNPHPQDLVIVTKVGAVRGEDKSWNPAQSSDELKRAVHDNLTNLGLDTLDVVNIRIMGDGHGPSEGSIALQFKTLTDLKAEGLIRYVGVSTVTATQIKEAQGIGEVACVQNQYNIVHREDDALIDDLAAQGIAYVPYFPLGGFTPIQSSALSDIATELQVTPMQLALAWLLYRSPNILLIPGTSSREHLRENLAVGEMALSDSVFERLSAIS